MTSDHDDQTRADLLARLEAGELEPDAPEVRALRVADPVFAAEVDDLLDLAAELTAASNGDADVGDDPEPWAGADRDVQLVVARELGVPGRDAEPGSPRPRTLLLPLVLAAAAAVVLAWIFWPPAEGPPPAPYELELNADGLWPSGTVERAAFLREGFVWEPRPGARGRVVIHLADGSIREGPWLSGERWRDPSFAELPATFQWDLEVRAAGRSPQSWTADVTLQ